MTMLSPEGVLSYPKLFKAELPKDAGPNDKPKFSTVVLFTHAAMKTPEFKAMEAAALACARDNFKERVEAMAARAIRRDVADMGHDAARFGCFININAGEDYPPDVIDRDGSPISAADGKRKIYPGVRARVSLSTYAYTGAKNKGVAFGLRNVQRLGDGPRLDNRKSAKDEFEPLPDEEPAGMPEEDVSSLMGE